MTVTTADAQHAADRWAEIWASDHPGAHWVGYVARKVVSEDLKASGVLVADEHMSEQMWQRLCAELLPRDGSLMDAWGSAEWLPVLARARELSGGVIREG